jgi:hypothetical protein
MAATPLQRDELFAGLLGVDVIVQHLTPGFGTYCLLTGGWPMDVTFLGWSLFWCQCQ